MLTPLIVFCDYCRKNRSFIIEGRTKDQDLITIVCQVCGSSLSIRGSYLRMLGIKL